MSQQDMPDSAGQQPADAPAELPPPRLPRPPFFIIAIGLVVLVASWIPLTISGVLRTTTKDRPRIAIIQDMGVQPKYHEQQTSTVFADGRAMRPNIPGTVAADDIDNDWRYAHGFYQPVFAIEPDGVPVPSSPPVYLTGYPDQVKVNADLLHRGQQRFFIYCAPCHGADGFGHGPINERALDMASAGSSGMSWTQAASLHDPAVRGQAIGQIFNTITNGIRNMPGYGAQIPVADRWAIVAYVRALQLSQDAPKSALTPQQVDALNSK